MIALGLFPAELSANIEYLLAEIYLCLPFVHRVNDTIELIPLVQKNCADQ